MGPAPPRPPHPLWHLALRLGLAGAAIASSALSHPPSAQVGHPPGMPLISGSPAGGAPSAGPLPCHDRGKWTMKWRCLRPPALPSARGRPGRLPDRRGHQGAQRRYSQARLRGDVALRALPHAPVGSEARPRGTGREARASRRAVAMCLHQPRQLGGKERFDHDAIGGPEQIARQWRRRTCVHRPPRPGAPPT